MNKNRCGPSTTLANSGCQASETQTVQPFPTSGPLADNLGLTLPDLKSEIGTERARACSYVLRSVKLDHQSKMFQQHGSAPNFQGGVLTLCTCKHQMRSRQAAEHWPGIWVAGFTSRTIYERKHWLFYLARIDSAHESQADLWETLKPRTRNAKVADRHFLGDIFRPKSPEPTGNARFLPSRYVTPTAHTHRHHRGDRGWWNDISYHSADKYRHPPLLLADPSKTFIWDEPTIRFVGDHCRNYQTWLSLAQLFARLREP